MTSINESLLNAEIGRYITFVNGLINQPGYVFEDEPVHNFVAFERDTLTVREGDPSEENESAITATAKLWLGNLDLSAGFPRHEQTGSATLYLNLSNAGWQTHMVVDNRMKVLVR